MKVLLSAIHQNVRMEERVTLLVVLLDVVVLKGTEESIVKVLSLLVYLSCMLRYCNCLLFEADFVKMLIRLEFYISFH